VIVRRAFTVSNEAGLSYAIDTINNAINSTSYITILINNNISLSGINQRNITSTWKGKNIILENNSALPNVTISGLKIEGNDTVGLVGVNIKGLIKAVVTSSSHSFALNYDGKLWATGLNNYGQLGLGDTSTRTSFQPVISSLPSDAQIVSIATGYGHSLALDSSGRVWATGYNFVGQLGLGNSGAGTDRNSFQQVTFTGLAPDVKIVAIAAGSFHSLALDSKGKLWGAGENEYGQLGLGDKTNRNSFQLVTSGLISSANITSIAAGSEHSLALDSSGTLWTTGYNFHGQLGLGDNIDQSVFKQVTIFKNAKIDSIAAGYFHSLALDSKGKLWGTGGNEYGQLGLGNIDSQNSFQLITFNGLASNTTIISIAAGSEHSLALDSSGKIWATGLNLYGQLGLGTSGSGMERNSFQPVTFTGLALDAKVVSISAGYSHSLAATSDDKIWSTGMNRYGQLGLGDVAQRSVFTPAPSF
jgi:alpha-tubulin suppressor-like RCC1 family protein